MNRKKAMAGFLAAAMLCSGMMALPREAKAEETMVEGEHGIEYILDDQTYNFKSLYEEKKAPVKEGYVFGGWYTKGAGEEMEALTEETAAGVSEAYAKFVPAYVLSMKAQNQKGTQANNGPTSVRLLSSVDALSYQKVGFEICLNNKKDPIGVTETTNVYSGLENAGSKEVYFANEIFGEASTHFSVWRLDNVADENDSKIIYVRPYWITPDGTKVEGLAKYIHIEDGYMNYISVPINLLTGEAVAAGTVEVSYNSEVFEYHGFEEGRLLPEMAVNAAAPGTVKLVGNAATLNQDVSADGLYGNLRFTVKEGKSEAGQEFTVQAGQFCNWDEAIQPVEAWNVTYK